MEKSGDFGRRVMEGTAFEGAEYEGVMTMEEAYAEDCADLASCNVEGLLRHVSFSSELYGISSVEIQGGAGYHGNIVRILYHRAVCGLTKDGGVLLFALVDS